MAQKYRNKNRQHKSKTQEIKIQKKKDEEASTGK
jgi:hypothetical protein